MPNFKIISDSACDLSDELIAKHDIELVYYYISTDHVNYVKDRVEMDLVTLYSLMRNKVFPKTSLPSIQDYLDVFRVWLSKGMDIICMTLTSKFSGSYQSALNAGEVAREEFPDRKIFVIDTRQATMMYGMTILEAAKLRDAGVSVERTAEAIETLKNDCGALIALDSLDFLAYGGRIGKAASLAGSVLNIKPVIGFKDGELYPLKKVRGFKKALTTVGEEAVRLGLTDSNRYVTCLVHCERYDEVYAFKKMLEDDYGLSFTYEPSLLGSVVGSHIGPTPLLLFNSRKLHVEDWL